MPFVTTACPVNCYSTCTIRVEVDGGRVRRVEPDPGNAATATGPCLKGLSWVERVHSPDRILHPLRRGPGGAGFERITWAAALAGFAALYSMDRIYDPTLMAGPARLHSANGMLTGLLLAGLLLRFPLLSAALLAAKLVLYLRRRGRAGRLGPAALVRGALRLGLGLLFPAALWIAGRHDWLAWALAGIAVGECIDRWEFYREIDPLTPERLLAIDLRRLLADRLGARAQPATMRQT